MLDAPELGPQSRAAIADRRNQIHVSSASVWEMSIQASLGKLTIPGDIEAVIADEGFMPLHITHHHAQTAGQLPMLHRYPFDRMLMALAQAEGLLLITADVDIAQYALRRLDAHT